MTELVNAVISEAKHTEPFLRLPHHLKKIIQVRFSAAKTDLNNIVKSKKIPKFLHSARYHAESASKQVGKELLNSCNKLYSMMSDIWKYLHIIDPNIIIPNDVSDEFDFFSFKAVDYDLKLTARYWTEEMSKLLLEMDSACRLAIKQQSRLVLCLFEVSPVDVSVFAAYNVMIHTQKLQSPQDNISESYIEFAKLYASMMDKLDVKTLKNKIATQSILYSHLEMDNNLIDHLSWLQKMLYMVPHTAIETWYLQFILMGPWMNRLFVPWMKEQASVSIFPDVYPPTKKTGPIETVAKALVKPYSLSFMEITNISDVLKDLYLGKFPSKTQMTTLEDMSIKKTGMSLLEWSVILDMGLEYESVSLVEGRLETEIQKDIDDWLRKKKRAEDALNEFLKTRVKIDPENSIYKAFAENIAENYEDLDIEDLKKKKDRWFPTMSESDFEFLIDYLKDYHSARNNLSIFQDEKNAPVSNRSRVTLTLNREIEEVKARKKFLEQVFIDEASKTLKGRVSIPTFLNYITWYKENQALQRDDFETFKRNSVGLLRVRWDEIEPLMIFLEDLKKIDQRMVNLEEELQRHTNRLVRDRHILTIFLFLVFNVGIIFFLWKIFFPIYDESPIVMPINPSNGDPIVPGEKFADLPPPITDWEDGALNVLQTWATKAGSFAGTWLYKKGKEKLELNGWIGFDWSRLFSMEFWTSDLLRGAGPVIMVLLYGKVLVTLGWSEMQLLWGISTMFGNTIVNAVFDENFTETWRQERSNVYQIGERNIRSLVANVVSLMEFHGENSRMTMLMGIQSMQYLPGGTYTRVLTNAATNYVQSPARANTSNTITDWVQNNNNEPQGSRNLPNRSVIEGPRVQELATESEDSDDLKLFKYMPKEMTDDDF